MPPPSSHVAKGQGSCSPVAEATGAPTGASRVLRAVEQATHLFEDGGVPAAHEFEVGGVIGAVADG